MVRGGNPSLLVPIFTPSDAESDIVWESMDTSIATVLDGMVTPVATGTTSIVARTAVGALSDACTVTVGEQSVDVTGIDLNYTSQSMQVGNTVTLIPFIEPVNASNTKVGWGSSDSNVAEVVNGRVTAKANGTATITATADGNHAITKTCTVTVTLPVTGITLSPKIIDNVEVGDLDRDLSATILPALASDKSLVWSSTDSNVATFNDNGDGTGTVHFVGPGSAKIVATTVDGGFADSCTVTVGVRVTAIRLEPATITMTAGGTTTSPQVILTPVMATNTTKWVSSATGVASINEDTGVITPVSAGTATITATPQFAKPGTLPAVCVVDVFNVTAGQMLKDDRLVSGKTAVSVKFTLNGPSVTKNAIVVTLNDGTVLQYGSSVSGVYTYTGTTLTPKAGVNYADVTIRGVVSFRLNFPV